MGYEEKKSTGRGESILKKVKYTNRQGKKYYLYVTKTKTGKEHYYCSTKQEGNLAPSLPKGYEMFENVNGQVFLRKKGKQVITDAELKLVGKVLAANAPEWRYRAEIKKNALVVHECRQDIDELVGLFEHLLGTVPPSVKEKLPKTYVPVLKIKLTNKKERLFWAETEVKDTWMCVGDEDELGPVLEQVIPRLVNHTLWDLI